MSQSALQPSSKKASSDFDQQDWASAYCNVQEELTNKELIPQKGSIPTELSGTIYRNGPGRLERNGHWVHHPFDGDGMITALEFNNGQATLSNRFVRTKAWQEEEEAGRFLYRGVFGSMKPGGPIANIFDLRLKNIANTNVVRLGGQLLALWEASNPHSLDPKSLETLGVSTLNGVLKTDEAFSAHPRFDPGHHKTPRMVTFGVKTGPKSTIRLMEFATEGPHAGELINERKDNFNGFAFLHDFAITPNWAIFLQNSLDFNPLPFVLGQKGAAQCLSSSKNSQGKFLLIPRQNGDFAGEPPRIFEAPNGFVFHHLNAWEEEGSVFVDSIFYDSFPSISPKDNFRAIDFELLPEGLLTRCEINLSKGEVSTSNLSQQCCEFATVNPSKLGLKSSYAWMAIAERSHGNGPLQAIKKLNLTNKDEKIWSAAPRGFVSEPLLLPKPNSESEDDGWINIFVWNGARKATDMVLLNAKDLSEEAIIELPLSVPHGLHGCWASTN